MVWYINSYYMEPSTSTKYVYTFWQHQLNNEKDVNQEHPLPIQLAKGLTW